MNQWCRGSYENQIFIHVRYSTVPNGTFGVNRVNEGNHVQFPFFVPCFYNFHLRSGPNNSVDDVNVSIALLIVDITNLHFNNESNVNARQFQAETNKLLEISSHSVWISTVMQIRKLALKGLFCSSGKEISVLANLETVINILNFFIIQSQ